MQKRKQVVYREGSGTSALMGTDLDALKSQPSRPLEPGENPGSRPVHPGSLPHQSTVTNMDFDVTEMCNLGCGYCFKGEKTTQNMTLDTAKRAFEWLLAASRDAPSVNCNFMGGEPTLRWELIREFVPWARRRGRARGKQVTFSMTSNLTLWTPEIREFVDECGFGVLMSIDGCPEVQDAQRPAKNGRPMSEVIEEWAKSMLRTRPRSTARATCTPRFVDRLFDGVVYLHSIGFREIAVASANYDQWTPEHVQALRDELRRIVAFVAERHRAGDPVNLAVFKFHIEKLIHPRRTGDEITAQPQPCGAGKGYMMVDHVGDIWPCHRFDGADADAGTDGALRLGNIFEAGFNDRLQSAFLHFDHMHQHKDRCNHCPVNEVCGGFCPAANVSSTGSLYTPHEAFCDWSEAMYRAAEALYEELQNDGEAFALLLEDVSGTADDGQR